MLSEVSCGAAQLKSAQLEARLSLSVEHATPGAVLQSNSHNIRVTVIAI
jgi:hypothetical protein